VIVWAADSSDLSLSAPAPDPTAITLITFAVLAARDSIGYWPAVTPVLDVSTPTTTSKLAGEFSPEIVIYMVVVVTLLTVKVGALGLVYLATDAVDSPLSPPPPPRATTETVY